LQAILSYWNSIFSGKEFKKFALKGSVMDMAVGVVIGAAFGKITSSLVTDIIMPPIGLITGGINFSQLAITLKAATAEAPAITLNYGLFINTIVDFLLIALAIFLAIKQINRLRKKEEDQAPAVPEDIQLLREIRDSLQAEK